MFSFSIWAVAASLAAGSASSLPAAQAVPVLVIDTRLSACNFEEQPYYFRGKADRRAEKVQAVLREQGVEYRVVRWEKDADVPDTATISAMGPKKYLRNC